MGTSDRTWVCLWRAHVAVLGYAPDATAPMVAVHRFAGVVGYPVRAIRGAGRWAVCLTFCLGVGLMALGGCAAAGGGAGGGTDQGGLVLVSGLPEETTVRVDDLEVGTLGQLPAGLPLRVGVRRIELRVPGGLTWRIEAEVRPGETQEWNLEPWPAFDEDEAGTPER